MSEVLTQRQNELCTIREKLTNLREQRDIILANEDLKSGGKGVKIETTIAYYDSQIRAKFEALERETKAEDTKAEQKLYFIEQKKLALAEEYNRKRQKLEAEFEAKAAVLDLEIERTQKRCEDDKTKTAEKAQSFIAYLEKSKAAQEQSLATVREVKSGPALTLDKQIRELEKEEAFTASVVNMTLMQLKRRDAPPEAPWVNPTPLPWDPEETELARLRADAAREVAERKAARECPYSPTELAYRSYA